MEEFIEYDERPDGVSRGWGGMTSALSSRISIQIKYCFAIAVRQLCAQKGTLEL